MFDFFSPIEAIRKISGQKAEKNINESFDYLVNDFRAIAKLFEEYYPLELLKLSLWQEKEDRKDRIRRTSYTLLPVLLQSVLSSAYFTRCGSGKAVKGADWNRLKGLGEDVLRRLIRIIDNRTALFLEDGEKTNADGENYRSLIASRLIPEELTEERLSSSSVMLRSLLREDTTLEEKTGVQSDTLWLNLDHIATYSYGVVDDYNSRLEAYKADFNKAVEAKGPQFLKKTPEEIYKTITGENGWTERAERLSREREGYSMFLLGELSSLESSSFEPFTIQVGALDIVDTLKKGTWPAVEYPFVRWNSQETYTFVGKYIPLFLSSNPVAEKRRATLHDVLAIFYRIGIDTYTYDGNSIEISVLPSFYDSNLFLDKDAYSAIKRRREEEKAIKASYGHKRLIVDPDLDARMERDGESLTISSAFMAEATFNKNTKGELIRTLLGQLDLPQETGEYKVVDEDELDSSEAPANDDVMDDTVTDEYEYDNSDENVLQDEDVIPPVEYEKKSVDIRKEEEKYALTDEIIKKDEETEKEEEKYEEELDDDIFDDSEEEEKLDEIGEKNEDEYYADYDVEEPVKEAPETVEEDGDDAEGDIQLDFFDLLDEDEEKVIDDELEREDEEEFIREEEKEEKLDENPIPSINPELTVELEKEDEISENLEEEKEEEENIVSGGELETSSEECELSDIEEEIETEDSDYDSFPVEETPEEVPSLFSGEEKTIQAEDEDLKEALPGDAVSDDESDSSSEDIEEEIETEDSFVLPETEEDTPVDSSLDDSEADLSPEVENVAEDNLTGEEEAENIVPALSDGECDSSSEDIEEETETEDSDSPVLPEIAEEDEPQEDAPADTSPEDSEVENVAEDNLTREEEPESEDSFVLPTIDNDEKPLDTNAWLSDFLGLNDIGMDDDLPAVESLDAVTDETPEDEVSSEDDSETVIGAEREEESSESREAEDEEATVPESDDEEEHQVLSMEELEEEPAPLPVIEEEEEEINATGIVYDIYKRLGSSSVFASFVKDSTAETIEELESVIQNCWERMQGEKKDKIFNCPEYSLSIILSHDALRDELRRSELINNAGGVMYARGKDSWTAVIIYIDSEYMLDDAMEKSLTRESFSTSDWKRVVYIGEQMRKR